MTTITRTAIVKVVGCSFVETYPGNLLRLAELDGQARLKGEQLAVVLVRNPDNFHDANAVEVHVPALGEMAMIGHVPRGDAARLAPRLDAGERFLAEVRWVRLDPEHPEHPGIDIAVTRVVD